jgi:hypothetical protein
MKDLRIQSLSFTHDTLTIEFGEDQSISVPLAEIPRLKNASAAERSSWCLIGRGLGVHWDLLDEDLSVENLLLAYTRSKHVLYAPSGAS